jgi:hypothetical protein
MVEFWIRKIERMGNCKVVEFSGSKKGVSGWAKEV